MNDHEGSLKLPNSLGAPITRTPVTRQIHEKWDTYDEIDESLQGRGFEEGRRPGGEFPNLTSEDLTSIDSKQYTSRYVEFLSWWRYAGETLATIKAQMLQIENEMSEIETETKKDMRNLAESKTKKPTADEVTTAVESQPRYKDLKLLKQRAEQSRLLMDTRLEYLERSLRLISRQVEIRRLDLEQGKVEHNMPMRGQSHLGGFRRMPGT